MFSCIKRKKTSKPSKVQFKEPKTEPFEYPVDTDDDESVDEEWITERYKSNELTPENGETLQLEKILGQRKCQSCNYIEYHITFKTLCILPQKYNEFAKSNSIKGRTLFLLNGKEYFHVECASQWVSETDMLYIPFTTKQKYNFILLAKTSNCYENNHFFCDCPRENKFNPDRWNYYKSVILS